MSVDYKDIITRAVKTFFQSFLGSLSVGLVAVDNWSALSALIFASAVAGISAVVSFAQNWIKGTL